MEYCNYRRRKNCPRRQDVPLDAVYPERIEARRSEEGVRVWDFFRERTLQPGDWVTNKGHYFYDSEFREYYKPVDAHAAFLFDIPKELYIRKSNG